MGSWGPRVAAASTGALLLLGIAACVDIFHATDFTTLCVVDAAACANDGAADIVSTADGGGDAGFDFCTWSSAQAESHAERACAWVGSCQGARPGNSFGKCMLRALAAYDCTINPSLRPRGPARALWECLADVSSCRQVSSCLFGPVAPTCAPVQAGAFTACSPGIPSTTVVECSLPEPVNPPVSIEPCVLEGRLCVAVDPSSAVCAGTTGTACTGAPRCIGTYAVECSAATDVGVDCAASGSGRCVLDDAGVACAPIEDARACAESSAITCDDRGVAHRCVGGRAVTIDCNPLGQPCREVDDAGVDPIVACTSTDAATTCVAPDECSGDVLRSCAQGKAFEVSCSTLGLGPCSKPPPGLEPVATCKAPR